MPTDEEGKKVVGGLRLILGPASETETTPKTLPTAFPHYMKDVYEQKRLLLSKELFKMVLEKFCLLASTPRVLLDLPISRGILLTLESCRHVLDLL